MRTSIGIAMIVLSAILLQGATLEKSAPRFTLKNSAHKSRALADFKGKVVVINFWASWCAPCQTELPELNRLAAAYAGRKVKVLAINVDPERSLANRCLAKLGLRHPAFEILWDSRSKVVSAYDIDAMPSSFIIDPRGVLRYSHTGYHPGDPDQWRREIDELLDRERGQRL